MSDHEQALIARAVLGADDQAFARLVALYQAPVRGFLRRLAGGDAALADDLAQETFLAAYRKIHSFRGEGRFQGWLMRIAYNAFLQDRRRPVRRETPHPAAHGAPDEAAMTTPLDVRLDLEQAMAALDEGERAALTLCFTYGMSHGEAAATLALPLGTVKSHIARGKEKLRKALAAWQGEVIS
ncbi:MAG: RNA polymerase sigma factor [Pseudomonadota bacterium]